MKKIIYLLALLLSFVGLAQSKKQTNNRKIATKTVVSDPITSELRNCHSENLSKSPFKKTLVMPKKQRKELGIPPNKYFESEYELTMDPITGRPLTEKLIALRNQLEYDRTNGPLRRVPGDAIDNNWIERGPTNVGGRTRAIMFDPNDVTNETVFAGGVSGGLWKNTNISNPSSTWSRLSIPENLSVSCIVADPNNSNIFYVGTGESYVGGDVNGDGVWKSINAGATWTRVLGGASGTAVFSAASRITVNNPSNIAGEYIMVEAPQTFGTFPAITTPITGDIVLTQSPTTPTASTVTEACNPITNGSSIAGKIALLRRGTCNFTVKVKNAQDAGAVAVIMMNNNTDLPFAMGGNDPLITIPAVMITQADGDMLQNALLSGNVSVTLGVSNGNYTGSMIGGIQHVNRIKIRNNAGTSEVYVAAGDSFYSSSGTTTYLGGSTMGLYKSIDQGNNWSEVAIPLTANGKKHSPNDIEIGADNKIWLSTVDSAVWGNGGGEVYSSTDGNTFTQRLVILGGKRTELSVSKTMPDKVYVLAEVNTGTTAATATVELIKTTDGFATTTTLPKPEDADAGIPITDFTRGQAGYDLAIAVDPTNDEKVFIGGINVFNTNNGGSSWEQKSMWFQTSAYPEVHSDQHEAIYAPNNSNKMIFANDGGVFYSNDGGTTVTPRNQGFNVTQFYTVAVAPTTNGMPNDNFVAGAQDNGSQMFLNVTAGQNSSTEVQGGDGAFCLFDQGSVDKYRITNYVYNNAIKLWNYTTNTNKNINSESAPGADNGSFINPMALDSNLDIIYSEYFTNPNYRIRRYKSIKAGVVRKALLSNPMMNSAATAITVSPFTTTSSTVLIGTRNGRLLKITNADDGTTAVGPLVTWTNITGPSFVGSVSDVEYGATENEIFVTFHNYNVASIWFTNDGGVTWQNKEGNFPDIPVKCILRNPLNNDEVIIGTELGVWRTETFNNATPAWIQSQNGMQNVKVTDLDLRNDNMVFASTYGRGIFSGQFTAPLLANESFVNNKNISIAPNPSTGVFSINMDKNAGLLNIEVNDLNGRIILNNKIDLNEKNSIDLSQFESGVYLIKITGDNINYSKKLIKN